MSSGFDETWSDNTAYFLGILDNAEKRQLVLVQRQNGQFETRSDGESAVTTAASHPYISM